MNLDTARKEKKFLCSQLVFSKLRNRLDLVFDRDEHSHGETGYVVRSLYFDSPFERDRWEVLAGIEERKKIRLRTYDPDAKQVNLEYKYKLGDRQKKSSFPLTQQQALQIQQGNPDFMLSWEAPSVAAIYRSFQLDAYRPRVLIEYDRIAWMGPMNDIRVTWDSNVRASRTALSIFSKDVNWSNLLGPSTGILEVKYNGLLASYVEEILMIVDSIPQAFSKYLMGAAL